MPIKKTNLFYTVAQRMSVKTRLPGRELNGVFGIGFVRAGLTKKRTEISDA